MIVIQCGEPNAVEKRAVEALRGERGVLLVNPVVPAAREGRGHPRELDLLWISPHGIAVIEVKGTEQAGVLRARVNGAWEVDGAEAKFYGSGVNPFGQARGGAQELKRFLEERSLATEVGRVRSVVLVVGRGAGITVDQPSADLGDVVVADLEHLVGAARGAMGGGVTVSWTSKLLTALDLPASAQRELTALEGEGFGNTPGSAAVAPRPSQVAAALRLKQASGTLTPEEEVRLHRIETQLRRMNRRTYTTLAVIIALILYFVLL